MVEARKSCATSEVDGILQNSAIARQIIGEIAGDARRSSEANKRRRVGYQSVQILQRRCPHWPEAFRSDDVVPNGAQTRTHPCLVERDSAE